MIRTTADNGVVYYRSALLDAVGVPHGFSTRIGGVSPPPFDTLNLGLLDGDVCDSLDNVLANRARLLAALKLSGRAWGTVHQVHGCAVVQADDVPPPEGTRADALVTRSRQVALNVRTADCAPILLASDDGAVVAAVHAGWRGAVGGVLPAAIAAMGVPPGRLLAAVGPCISRSALEVGPEVLAAFEAALGGQAPVTRRGDGKGYVDLPEALRLQALRARVPEGSIDLCGLCTVGEAGEFFSHRRDRGITGRMSAVIGVASA